MKDDPKEEAHPSYVMVGLYRTSGGGSRNLFGSAIKHHPSTMRLRIVRAVRVLDEAHDRYYGRVSKEILEIEMSSTQFAELVTTPNVGSGVPATLRFFNGEQIEDPPKVMTETERMRVGFKDRVQNMVETSYKFAREIKDLTKSLGAKTKRQIDIKLGVMTDQIASNAPFFVDMFHEAADRVVMSAKIEIEAFAGHVLRATGIETIANGGLPKQLAESVGPVAADIIDAEEVKTDAED